MKKLNETSKIRALKYLVKTAAQNYTPTRTRINAQAAKDIMAGGIHTKSIHKAMNRALGQTRALLTLHGYKPKQGQAMKVFKTGKAPTNEAHVVRDTAWGAVTSGALGAVLSRSPRAFIPNAVVGGGITGALSAVQNHFDKKKMTYVRSFKKKKMEPTMAKEEKNLNELSAATYGRYLVKASKQIGTTAANVAKKRAVGVKRAINLRRNSSEFGVNHIFPKMATQTEAIGLKAATKGFAIGLPVGYGAGVLDTKVIEPAVKKYIRKQTRKQQAVVVKAQPKPDQFAANYRIDPYRNHRLNYVSRLGEENKYVRRVKKSAIDAYKHPVKTAVKVAAMPLVKVWDAQKEVAKATLAAGVGLGAYAVTRAATMGESISHAEIYKKIDHYKSMGYKVSDVHVSDHKASFVVTDKEGDRRRHEFGSNGKRTVHSMASTARDDDDQDDSDVDADVTATAKRGRPANAKHSHHELSAVKFIPKQHDDDEDND